MIEPHFHDVSLLHGYATHARRELAGAWHGSIGLDAKEWVDASGNRNTGTLQNSPAVVASQWGPAMSCNGVNQYADAGDVLDIGTSDLSVIAWMLLTGFGVDNAKHLVQKRRNSVGADGYGIRVQSSGKFRVTFGGDAGGTYVTPNAGISVDDGKWHCVAAVFDRSDSIQTYVDGVADQSVDISAEEGVDVQNSETLKIGAGSGSSGILQFEWLGLIAGVAIIRSVVTPLKIRQLALPGGMDSLFRLGTQLPSAGNRRRRMILFGAGA